MFVFILTCLHVHCIFGVAALEKTGCLDREITFFFKTTEDFMVQSSKRYTKCVVKLNIQTGWRYIILDLKMIT
jgi:hypothetical protein